MFLVVAIVSVGAVVNQDDGRAQAMMTGRRGDAASDLLVLPFLRTSSTRNFLFRVWRSPSQFQILVFVFGVCLLFSVFCRRRYCRRRY